MTELSTSQLIGYSAGLISFLNMFWYMRAIIRSSIRPSLTYWLLAEVAMILIAVSSYALWDRTTLWIAVAYATTQIAIIAIALRYQYAPMHRLDKMLFVFAFLSILLWWYTKNPLYALVINVGIDASSYIPLFRKAWKNPLSEDITYWMIAGWASVLNMFAVTSLTFTSILYPWYLGIVNATVFIILFARRPRSWFARMRLRYFTHL